MQVNMLEAKTNLSKLIKLLEDKEEPEIILARGGAPVAKLVPFTPPDASRRIGAGKAIALAMDEEFIRKLSFEALTEGDEEIAAMFYGEEDGQ